VRKSKVIDHGPLTRGSILAHPKLYDKKKGQRNTSQ